MHDGTLSSAADVPYDFRPVERGAPSVPDFDVLTASLLLASLAFQEANLLSADDLRGLSATIKSESELGAQAKARLRRMVGNARIVMLGELTHGDGTSFALKTTLVKFLHAEMGFDVLVWESGFYDCSEMDRELASDKPIGEVARLGVFDHWSRAAESLPVFEYARSTQGSNRPLRMAGFDIQASGKASDYMIPEMIGWFGDRMSQSGRKQIDALLEAVRTAAPENFDAAYAKALGIPEILLREHARLEFSLNRAWGDQAAFRVQALNAGWNQAFMHKVANLKSIGFSLGYNLREQANAENLNWLADQQYKGKKLIVWGHNAHVFKRMPGTGGQPQPAEKPEELDSTGRILAESRGHEIRSIGVLALGGRWSWRGGDPIDFAPAEPDSLEAALAPHFPSLGFVDLRSSPPGHPLREPWKAVIDRQNPFTLRTVWPDGFDGLLFVREMRPRTQLP